MPQPHQRLPSTSTRKPSGVPPGSAVMSTRPFASLLPSPMTSIDADDARRHARFDDVELRLVGREGEAVRPVDVAGDHRQLRRSGVEPVDVGRQLGRRHVAFVVAEDAERRIGEPDRAVRLARRRRSASSAACRRSVSAITVIAAVVLGARHAPRVVLAGEQPALPVARVAVGVVRRLAEDADARRSPRPTHDAVVRECRSTAGSGRRRTRPALRAQRKPVAIRSTAASVRRYLSKLGSRIRTAGSG